jgi:hypothetical protein
VEETPSTEAAQTATPDAEEKLWPELDGLLKDEDALSTPNAPYLAAVAEYRVVVYEPGTQVFVEDYAVKEFGKVESPEVAPEELQAKLGKENAGNYKSQSLHRRWRHGAFGGSVTVSADALAAQLEEERAGNPREAPVILEVQGLRVVVADTRQEILNGLDLVIQKDEL